MITRRYSSSVRGASASPLFIPSPLSLLGIAAALAAFGIVVYLVTRHDYGEIELEGDLLTAKHLYTGRTVQLPVTDILIGH